MIIGLAGNATVGKDTFFNLLRSYSKEFVRYAFADSLKSECNSILLNQFKIDIYDNKQKIIARDFLVAWGCLRREMTNGQYWIDKIKEEIDINKNIPVITDVRFATYIYDELNYIRDNGILVYIDKFCWRNCKKEYTPPANDKEAYNNPILKKNADYLFEWENCGGNIVEIENRYNSKIKDFIKWFQTKI